MYMYNIYIYIYLEREREREREIYITHKYRSCGNCTLIPCRLSHNSAQKTFCLLREALRDPICQAFRFGTSHVPAFTAASQSVVTVTTRYHAFAAGEDVHVILCLAWN